MVAWLRRLVFSAVCAGLLTGLLVTVAHQIGTVPVILKAEVYEQAADAAAHGPPGTAHDHETHAWQPRDGVERISYTVLADVLTAIGLVRSEGRKLLPSRRLCEQRRGHGKEAEDDS